ncbi:hypothetical protein EV175_002339 [Coemansia sp. RSA 1933]|nr:hypothetical protein EV175_002339 [Coemansia sp. RSA 1933]
MQLLILLVFIYTLGVVTTTDAAASANIIGYYASWKQAQTVGVDFSKYTHINLAFGVPAQDGTISFDESLSLPTIISQIQGNNTKALVSLGGWSDSNYFTKLVSDTTTGNPFITNIVNFVDTNKLDGIDLDWEYPGRAGDGCNNPDLANDTPNYLIFLTNLRAAFTSKFGEGKKIISMAVRVQPFDVNGSPTNDVSGFAKVVDYINLMQYDINGAWNTETGPNAPLNFEQGKGLQASFVSAIDAWTGAGWPANQINGGLPFYGRATTALEDMTKDPTNQYQSQSTTIPQGDEEDATWPDPCTGVSTFSGTWQWKHLRDQGVLTTPDTAASPWVRQWDSVSQTPWLFNTNTMMFLSYDDPTSLTTKVEYAKSKGLAGSMVWAMYMDYNGELLDTVIEAWGGSTEYSNPSSGADSSDDNTDNTTDVSSDDSGQYYVLADDDSSSDSANVNSVDTDTVQSQDTTGGAVTEGASCSTEFELQCGSDSGSSYYYVCLYNEWVKESCAPGTVCTQQSDSILCDWPQ